MLATRRATLLATATATAGAALFVGGVLTAGTAHAAAGCQVNYSVDGQWSGGFTSNITITNLGDPVSSWNLRWSYSAGQQVSSAWNATVTQNGSQVTATNLSYNGNIGTGGTASFGFNGTWNNSSNPAPNSFTLNGVACTGGTAPTTAPPTTGAAHHPAAHRRPAADRPRRLGHPEWRHHRRRQRQHHHCHQFLGAEQRPGIQ
ncbi:cellulose-binding domain-containing protein [Verrucosispora sioxanthis]|uniref:cellulose-binding domain-containing protein n=1 Tax=Verrucosispora sioxanthis TaxID=2499994 RepID=UPI00359F604C